MCSAPLRELSNPGASGSIFYLTVDDEFIIKTVQHKEGEFLQKLLPGYYMVSLVCGVYLWCEVKFYFYTGMYVVGYGTGPVGNQILILPGNVVPSSSIVLGPGRMHYVPLKCWDLLNHSHSVTSQGNRVLSYTAGKTSDLCF